MTKHYALRWAELAVFLIAAFVCQVTWALAATTGGLGGIVTDETGVPVAGATVRVASPSQVANTRTDSKGHFFLVSLSPDTYTVTIEKEGYAPVSVAGITVFANEQQTLAFRMTKALKTIARVTSTAPGALIRAGTTSDLYSVNAATAQHVTGIGGGGSLDQAYSAIATMPGAYVPVGQAGWYQAVYIRGGDYDQVGYEVDGVPVNRSFDNYPSSTASSLGQQEVQVYTGASPANAEGQGLAGYINQVIKTGTFPGFATSDLGIGTPDYYHKANVEVGGSTPNRLFSYYVGVGGYDQDHRLFDQDNGAAISPYWGGPGPEPCGKTYAYVNGTSTAPLSSCFSGSNFEPTWWVLGPYASQNTPYFTDREAVVNFHFGIPHHHDGGRDDIQLLYQNSQLDTQYSDSADDFTLPWVAAVYGPNGNGSDTFCYVGGRGTCNGAPAFQSNIPLGATFGSSAALAGQSGAVVNYAFPNAPASLAQGGNIPTNLRGGFTNGLGIVKIQYQKNFSSAAYFRIYGYTLYSDWLNADANGPYTGVFAEPTDYELESHTRGISATFADQITPTNLLQLQGSFLTAYSLRDNNTQYVNGVDPGYDADMTAVAVSSANPLSGICYSGTGAAANCSWNISNDAGLTTPLKATLADVNAGALCVAGQTTPCVPALPGSCGGAACEWLTVGNGLRATYNNVKPNFGSGSLTDEWDPIDRLHINLGVRYDSFQFVPQDTDYGMRNFWFNAWNASECYNTANRIAGVDPLTTPVTGGTGSVTAACVAQYGPGYAQATLSPVSFTQNFTVWQPRVGITYTINPLNVIRVSWGKYDQAPNTAFEQYNTLQQNLPAIFAQGTLGGYNLFGYGRNAPTYPIRPELSYNSDLSWEHQFKGSDVSFKLTPFYRKTQDQVEQFFLDITTGFVSGLNVGTQTSEGVEFELQKGDFSRNGFSALLSYTYTNAYIQYKNLNGGPDSLLDPTNQAIAGYNAFTKTCATNPSAAGCNYKGASYAPGGSEANVGPCFTTSGAAVPAASCTAADVANPYWNDTPKAFLDTNGQYWPYDIFLGPPGYGSYGSFVAPHVATLVLNYKHDKWAVTPALQFSAGSKYGYPESTLGVNPSLGCGSLGIAPSTSRNPFTYTGGGSAYDGTSSCADGLAIPDQFTNQFDPMGSFTEPSRLTLSTQLTYDVTPKLSVVATFANILDTCFGGSKEPWTQNVVGISNGNKVCNFDSGPLYSLGVPPTGNNYNPGTPSQPILAYPYQALFGDAAIPSTPFNAFIDFRLRI
jgi:hypothetical protein